MKIRKPWLVQTLCLLGYALVRLLIASVPYRYVPLEHNFSPRKVSRESRLIYCLWHEYLLVPMMNFGTTKSQILTSGHTDGTIIAEMSKYLRIGTVRGSTTRGSVEAVRRILRPSRFRNVAVAVDGPRGPRRVVQQGIIYLASKTGWPIVTIGVGYQKPWRLKSWDRLAVPRPWRNAFVLTTSLVRVPPNLDREEMESYRQLVEQQMHELTALAEHWAETGRAPTPAWARAKERAAAAA
jgi:lysophospholipid acyltransferase (LPLAT)-like uncharacterized protein